MTIQRVLVAEDEFIVGMDLCDTVKEAGFIVEGPHPDLGSAMLSLQKNKPDIAILDVRLADGDSFPLAERLMEEDIPIVFHSGEMRPNEVRRRFPDAVACAKPCPPNEIIDTVNAALSV